MTRGTDVKLVVAGRGRLAVRGAELLALTARATGIDVEVACLPGRDDRGGADGEPSLRLAARVNGWPCREEVRDFGLGAGDLLVSLQHADVIRMADLGGARALNLHFSPLPRHRGSLSCYWPIVERDAEAGVTLHEFTAEVDAGPIVATRSFPLPRFTTAGELFDLFHSHAFDLLTEHAEAALRGTYTAREQEDPGRPAHRRRDVDFTRVEITDFTGDAAAVRDRCLALVFPGRQLPTFRGRAVRHAYVLPVRTDRGEVGEVLAETAWTALIRCGDGQVCFEFDR